MLPFEEKGLKIEQSTRKRPPCLANGGSLRLSLPHA
jgi:hypothetical protein